MLGMPLLLVEFDDVEGSQRELVAFSVISQCSLHVATTRPTLWARQIEFCGDDSLLQSCCLNCLGKGIEAFQFLCLLLAIGIKHKHLPVDIEHHLHVTVNLAGHSEALTVNALL